MTDYGAQDTSTTTLGTNQFPISEGWTPNAGFSATEAGPQTTDSGGKKSAPVSVYTKDGSDVTLGTSSDANTVASVMGRLTKIRDLLNATLSVGGTITEANSAAIKTDLDALNTAIGLISDAAWSGSGSGSEIAILKKIVAELAGTLTVSGAVTTSGTVTEASSAAIKTDADSIVTNTSNINTATGTKTDTKATDGSTTAWSVIALLKGIIDKLLSTLAVTQSGTWTVQPGNTANTTAWKVDGSGVTQPVSGTVTANAGTNLNTSALALEAGHLATIDSHIPAQGQALAAASVPVVLPATQITTLTPPAAITGFALEAGHLANIDTHTPAQGQATMANSSPVVIASNQSDLPVKGDFAEQSGLSAGALNADLVPSTDVSAYAWLSLHITAVAVGATITFQASNDNFATQVESVNLARVSSSTTISSTSTTTGIFEGPVNFRYFRARQTAWTSGSTTGVLELYTVPKALNTVPSAASQAGTWTVQPGNTPNTTPWLVSAGPPADLTLLASGAQTLTQTLADQTNFYGKGLRVVLDMTVVGTGSVTLEIGAKDVASWKYVALLTRVAVTNNSTESSVHPPTPTSAANSIAKDVLPHTWRVKVVANNANSATYSVGASYLN